MMQTNAARIRLVAAAMGLTLLAGCVTPPPPPPPAPPPPPPVVEYIPYRPTPPGSASTNMYIPPRDINGIRQTVNYGLSTQQTIWNLRSALNVAALNCLDPQHAEILPAYRNLLTRHDRKLGRVNREITSEFRAKYGSAYRPEFDGYMTQVYNYFALPPAQKQFCNTALEVANASQLVKVGELENFALMNLGRIESVFDNFYGAYEQYQVDVVAWDAKYAPLQPTVVNAFAADGGFNAIAPTATQTPTYGSTGPVIRSVEIAPSSQPADVAAPGFGPQVTMPVPGQPGPAETTQPVFVSNPVVQDSTSADDEGG